MRKVNLLWTPLDYVSQPPLMEDFSILDKKVPTETTKEIKEKSSMDNKQHLDPPTQSTREQAIRLKQLLHWSQEWTGSPPLNTSPLCECSEDSTGSETLKITVDCKLHGHISDGRQSSIVLSRSSSRGNSFSDSESSKGSSSSSGRRRRDKNSQKTLISDPKIVVSSKYKIEPRQETQNKETQFSLANWFLHTFSDKNRESADRTRLNVHKLPRHMKEQLKHIYVY